MSKYPSGIRFGSIQVSPLQTMPAYRYDTVQSLQSILCISMQSKRLLAVKLARYGIKAVLKIGAGIPHRVEFDEEGGYSVLHGQAGLINYTTH